MKEVITFLTFNDPSNTASVQQVIDMHTKRLNGKVLISASLDNHFIWKGSRLDMYLVTSFPNDDSCKTFAETLASISELDHVCCFLSKRGYRTIAYIMHLLGKLLYRAQPSEPIDEECIVEHIRGKEQIWFTDTTFKQALQQPLDTPMHIVTFNDYRDQALYAEGTYSAASGKDAYNTRYGNAAILLALRHGAYPVYLSTKVTLLYASDNHPLDQKWNDFQVNAYVTRRDFFQLIQSDGYAKASEHRTAALNTSFIQCSTVHDVD